MGQTKPDLKKYQIKKYPTIGVCGLDCGLCPRYYTIGPSRCPGCAGPDFFNKHPSCSFITCCVKIKNFDDGRSRSFFCKEVALLDLTSLESALDEATQKIKIDHIKPDDIKIKAKILKSILVERR